MMRLICLAALQIACAYGTTSMQISMDEPSKHRRDAEVDTQIALLSTPFGGGPHQQERERAATWLVANAHRSYPQIMADLVAGHGGVALVELLPRFGRAQSIPILEHLLTGPEATAWAAGQALALHPQAEAGEALVRSLAHQATAVAVIAADALGTRGDRSMCPALLERIHATDPQVRYHVLQAAGHLGCLPRQRLEALARSDTDADVRDLATRLSN
jgi:HEAT repeats